ncbi:MAG TPA: adenosine deaminase [Opitutales bacterium]|jgi:adenosine deaminase|nr:adenosine deaminase [Opitutales bacterium]
MTPAPPSPLTDYIRRLPKTETHLHIEGALPWELLQRLDARRFVRPPASWAADFRYDSFEHFERELLDMAFVWYISPERYHEAAKMIFARHLEHNVRYVETSFASGVIEFGGVNGREVLDAIHAAVPKGLEVRVFLGIHHNGCPPKMRAVLEDSLSWAGLAGLDLHGVESVPLEDWTRKLWPAARKAGKFTKAHAGEFCGADFVRTVIEELGVQRIQHGTRAIEDPAVVALAVERGIAFDLCPISNVKLGVTPSLREHSLRHLRAAGVLCTVSTDDPICFGNTLQDEYEALAREMNFTREELADVARAGFQVALVDEAQRARWLREVDAVAQQA